MNFHMDESEEFTVLHLEGRLDIEKAEEFKAILIKSLDAANHLIVNLEKVTYLSLPCLQLLYSAQLSAKIQKKRISLGDNFPDVFREAVEEAGFSLYLREDAHQGESIFT